MGELQTFTPGQVMAMLLTKLKETADNALKQKTVDVVVSVSGLNITVLSKLQKIQVYLQDLHVKLFLLI